MEEIKIRRFRVYGKKL